MLLISPMLARLVSFSVCADCSWVLPADEHQWAFNGLRTDGIGASVLFAKVKVAEETTESEPKERSKAKRILARLPRAQKIPKNMQIISIDIGQINVSFFPLLASCDFLICKVCQDELVGLHPDADKCSPCPCSLSPGASTRPSCTEPSRSGHSTMHTSRRPKCRSI